MESVSLGQRTVLVLGMSQHGKSKTIASLLEGQGIVEQGPAVGKGIASQTTDPALFRAHREGEPTRLRAVLPWDSSVEFGPDDPYPQVTQAIADASDQGMRLVGDCDAQVARHSRKVWDCFQYDGSYKAEPSLSDPLLAIDAPEQGGLQVRFLDTPGLESSDGRDDESMAKVLETLEQSSNEVACVLLVAQVGAPFSATWVKQVRRYWQQFPKLQTHWVVVHTRAEPLGARNCEWARQDSCFERDCFERMRALTEHFREFMAGEADSVRHVFMEHCTPGASEFRAPPGCEAIKHFQVKTQNALLLHIAGFAPVSLGELTYRKSETMEHIDQKMLEWLRGREATAKEYRAFCAKQLVVHMKNKEARQRQVDKLDREAGDLRDPRMTAFQTFVANPPHNILKRSTYTQRVGGVDYQTVEAVTQKQRWWHADCKKEVVWIPEDSEWEVRITAPRFRAVRQNVQIVTTSAEKHQRQIERISADKAALELQILEVGGEEIRVKTSMKETEEQLQHYCDLQTRIVQDMTLADYRRTRDFYTQAQRHGWTGEQCCRQLAAAHSMVLPLGVYRMLAD